MDIVLKISAYVTATGAIIAVIAKFWKALGALTEGQKCLLRGQIVSIYYRHCNDEEPKLREYERKTMDASYDAYSALHGNSFVKDIYATMREWKVIP